jgi:hypothetical protein
VKCVYATVERIPTTGLTLRAREASLHRPRRNRERNSVVSYARYTRTAKIVHRTPLAVTLAQIIYSNRQHTRRLRSLRCNETRYNLSLELTTSTEEHRLRIHLRRLKPVKTHRICMYFDMYRHSPKHLRLSVYTALAKNTQLCDSDGKGTDDQGTDIKHRRRFNQISIQFSRIHDSLTFRFSRKLIPNRRLESLLHSRRITATNPSGGQR